ncbi:MAG TPA: YebC/PmpR family DNA-binding transcriptional regulator [Syntrophaceae bacterium]|nr:YebC/PmpR family DNA-binding transcriptional regulator [Syntrophaceae bacterium]
MSGHSKWSSIKHKKSAVDAKRGRIFSKLIREIMVAARLGGGDPDANPRLRTAIAAAKAQNMPKDNIERAIKKGTGELEGTTFEDAIYEGYGPGGVAVLVEVLTDNKQRAVADIRHMFSKNGGSLGESGCVSWLFEKKGLIVLEKGSVDEDKLLDVALEAGAEDVREEETTLSIITPVSQFEAVKEALGKAGLRYSVAEISMIPRGTVKLEDKKAEQMIRLMQALEDCDDVQHVYANFDIPDEIMEAMS